MHFVFVCKDVEYILITAKGDNYTGLVNLVRLQDRRPFSVSASPGDSNY
jgi:hypothetical protein